VHQNLLLGQKGKGKGSRWGFDDMYAMFPRLKERQHTEAGVMSGGEQQMLTLCRTLMGDPDLIIIDEPTEGLAPKIVELVGEYLKKIKERGVSVLLIEQKLTIAMNISDRALVMGHGSIVFDGTPEACAPTRAQGVAGGLSQAGTGAGGCPIGVTAAACLAQDNISCARSKLENKNARPFFSIIEQGQQHDC
jgi:ABC-type branched-subunit amino acid transport system ATPase component